MPAITSEQQEAFCRAVQRAAQATIEGTISARERSDLAWHLDQLQALHHKSPLGGRRLESVPLGIARTRLNGAELLIDTHALMEELKQNFPDRAGYEVTFELSDGRHLLVELEQAPPTEVGIALDHLPDWARMWNGRQ